PPARSANFGAISLKSFCVICGVMIYAAAWRRDCNVSRLPSVIIFSATGRAAFARVSVVVIRPCSSKFVTRFRNVARRCHGLRPSFEREFRCRITLFLCVWPEHQSCSAEKHPLVVTSERDFCPLQIILRRIPKKCRQKNNNSTRCSTEIP